MTSLSAGRLLRLTAAAGAVGALSLVEPRHLGPWSRAAYRMGSAVVSGLLVADTTTEEDSLLAPALDGVLAASATLGLMDLSEHIDRRIIDGLQSLGMTRPRLLLAGIGAAGAAAMYLLPAATRTEDDGEYEAFEDDAETVEMPQEVRALITALLAPPAGGGGLAGAPALRAQLGSARMVEVGYRTSDVTIDVEQAERLAVPRNQTWPVTGRFEQGGFRFSLELQIDAGRLGMLSVMLEDEEGHEGEAVEFLEGPDFALPSPQELTLHRETETETETETEGRPA